MVLTWYMAIGAFIIFGLFAKESVSVLREYPPGVVAVACVLLLIFWLPGLLYYGIKK